MSQIKSRGHRKIWNGNRKIYLVTLPRINFLFVWGGGNAGQWPCQARQCTYSLVQPPTIAAWLSYLFIFFLPFSFHLITTPAGRNHGRQLQSSRWVSLCIFLIQKVTISFSSQYKFGHFWRLRMILSIHVTTAAAEQRTPLPNNPLISGKPPVSLKNFVEAWRIFSTQRRPMAPTHWAFGLQ